MGTKQIPCYLCNELCNRWRQCPHNDCRLDIAYCEKDGGDGRAVAAMEIHLTLDHKHPNESKG